MVNKIAQLINETKFEEAYSSIEEFSLDEKWELISSDLYDEDPKIIYAFLMYLVAKDSNEADWQFYCCLYLVYCNPFFDDTMRLAAWHVKQAIVLDPDNTEYKKQVISTFYSYADQYFTTEEYYKYTQDVLQKEPGNTNAIEVQLNLEKY